MDANTEEALGGRVATALRAAGVRTEAFVFPLRSGLTASLEAAASVEQRLRSDRALLAVGSGVITDIVRYAAHRQERDFVSVPTAASMDGYASSVAAMQLDGVKVTFPARAPRAIFADLRVAAAAPAELTRSGIGDLLAKASARTDWLAAHQLYGEAFCASVAERVAEPLSFAATNVERLLRPDPGAIRGLLVGLVQSGIAMAMMGSSRPASGCEHHASHFWDLLAARGVRAHAPHGLQVGYATHFAMRLQRFAFAGGVRSPSPPAGAPGAAAPQEPLDADARAWLGEPSEEIVAAVREKQRLTATLPAGWPDGEASWGQLRARLAPALEVFPAVERALTLAAIPAEPGFLGLDDRTLRATFRYASRLRARYTVIDFLEGQGALEAALDVALPTSANARAGG
jgi:glycerol-1-phosphate dehydrogenase [NAD(P)+]